MTKIEKAFLYGKAADYIRLLQETIFSDVDGIQASDPDFINQEWEDLIDLNAALSTVKRDLKLRIEQLLKEN